MLSNLADFADHADRPLVLGVVLRSVERALLVGSAAIDRCVAGSADLKLGKLVKLNFDCIVRVALALRLDGLGLLGC